MSGSRGSAAARHPAADVTLPQVMAWRVRRHNLEQRAPHDTMLAIAARLGGLQAQLMSSAELSLWARIENLEPHDVPRALWEQRTLVKTWAMRGTLHLLPSDELLLWQTVPSLDRRYQRPAWLRYFGVSPDELERLITGVAEALDGRLLTREELVSEVSRLVGSDDLAGKLRHSWGSMLKPAAFRGQLCFAPSAGQNVRFTHPQSWLGGRLRPVDMEEAEREVTRRFLAAHAPTSREVYGQWLGVPAARAGRMIQALGDEVTPVDVEGTPGWALTEDLDELRRASPTRTVNLLPAFDQYVLAASRHATNFLPGSFRDRVYRPQGWLSPVLLVNGRMDGIWRSERKGSRLLIEIEPFVTPPTWARQRAEVEAERLANFMGRTLELTWRDAEL